MFQAHSTSTKIEIVPDDISFAEFELRKHEQAKSGTTAHLITATLARLLPSEPLDLGDVLALSEAALMHKYDPSSSSDECASEVFIMLTSDLASCMRSLASSWQEVFKEEYLSSALGEVQDWQALRNAVVRSGDQQQVLDFNLGVIRILQSQRKFKQHIMGNLKEVEAILQELKTRLDEEHPDYWAVRTVLVPFEEDLKKTIGPISFILDGCHAEMSEKEEEYSDGEYKGPLVVDGSGSELDRERRAMLKSFTRLSELKIFMDAVYPMRAEGIHVLPFRQSQTSAATSI